VWVLCWSARRSLRNEWAPTRRLRCHETVVAAALPGNPARIFSTGQHHRHGGILVRGTLGASGDTLLSRVVARYAAGGISRQSPQSSHARRRFSKIHLPRLGRHRNAPAVSGNRRATLNWAADRFAKPTFTQGTRGQDGGRGTRVPDGVAGRHDCVSERRSPDRGGGDWTTDSAWACSFFGRGGKRGLPRHEGRSRDRVCGGRVRRPDQPRHAGTSDGGHRGGTWKAAYADFVAARMAPFIVLGPLRSASEPEKIAISGYFKDPAEPGSNRGAA
jgi:hypothetical protein